jgi:hypothetical protein
LNSRRSSRQVRNRQQIAEAERRLDDELTALEGLPRYRAARALRRLSALPPRFLYKFHGPESRGIEGAIQTSAIWLSSPDAFNDPFDMRTQIEFRGTPGQRGMHAYTVARQSGMKHSDALKQFSRTKAKPPDLQRAFDTQRLRFGVACFAASRSRELHAARNVQMWSHYADHHRGVCLQFHVPSAASTLVRAIAVRYTNEFVSIDWADRVTAEKQLGSALLRKALGWAYEHERRIIVPWQANSLMEFNPDGLRGVILGVQANASTAERVVALCRARLAAGMPPLRLYSARMKSGAYQLAISRRADLESAVLTPPVPRGPLESTAR